MINFFYDSLETVKNLKHPTKKEYINLTLSIVAIVVISGLLFIAYDSVFQTIYQAIYDLLK